MKIVAVATTWIRRSVNFLSAHWPFTVATLIHYALTAVAGLTLIDGAHERFDDIDGTAVYRISDQAMDIASNGMGVLMFPLAYLSEINGSWAIGLLVLNSPFVCFSPIWVPALILHIRARRHRATHHSTETH